MTRTDDPPVRPAPEADARDARRHNNFGALRLVFAVFVLFSHSFPLATGVPDADPLTAVTFGVLSFGGVAVDGFFLISGCLITQSWARSRSAGDFVVRRVSRIYPGYLVALAFSAAAGVAGSSPESAQYVKSLYYDQDRALHAALFLDYDWLDQPEAFRTNPFPRAVNRSLWTLKTELQCYAITLVLGVFGLAGGRRATLVILTCCCAVYALQWLHLSGTSHRLVRFLTFYFLGAAVAGGVFGSVRLTPLRVLAAGVAVSVALQSRVAVALVYPPAFAYLVFGVAYSRFTPGASVVARRDLSYGVFLYGYPVQQLVVKFAGPVGPAALFVIALPVAAACAAASWRFVERPMIARAHRRARPG